MLSPFRERKNRKLGIRLEKNISRRKKTDRQSYYNQEEWLEQFLDNKGGFYDGSEGNDSENNDKESYWKYESSCLQMFFKITIPKNLQISQESTSVGVSF